MIEHSLSQPLYGIKVLAKDLKKAEGLQHARALDRAAVRAGYQNFRHARNQLACLGPRPRSEPVVPTWVTVAWRDAATGQGGRETCLVPLSRPISTVVSRAQLAVAQNLGGFSVRAADHLVSDLRAQHQNGARWQAAVAARTLQFIDATGLKPTSSARRIYPGSRSANAVPETDHGIGWYDPGTRTYLYTDEPYNGSVESVAQAREAWVERHKWAMLKPTWRGMHRPGITELFVMAPRSYDLDRVGEALDRLPAWPDAWPGLSRTFGDGFTTPAEAKDG